MAEVKISIVLPKDLHDRAVARARQEERSLAALIRVAVREYLWDGNRPSGIGAA